MFEQFLIDLLNKILGDYVDNLQTNQLNLGVWSGDVVLRDLRLKRDALDKFNLPLTVKEGYLGDLRLFIPWANLKNQAVKINIYDIFLLVGAAGSDFYDEEKERQRDWKAKMERLETAELVQQQQVQLVQDSADESKNSGFFESLMTKIIDNLQINVRNVHIRYEDSTSHPGTTIAVGLTMSGLAAVSTDENWLESFIQQTRTCIYKAAKLDLLSVYWNVGASTIIQANPAETIHTFRSQIPTESNRLPDGFQYVIHPISGKANLILNKHQTHDRPRVNIDLIFDDFSVTIEELQYHSIHYLINEFTKMTKLKEYHRFRPAKGVTAKDNPRAFWKFAVETIRQPIHDRIYKWSWPYFKERRRLRKTYVRLWKYKRRTMITKEDMKLLQDMERELTFEDIRFFRSIADIQLKKEASKTPAAKAEPEPKQETSGWLSGWWYAAPSTTGTKLPLIPEEQRKLIFETIDFREGDVFEDVEVADSDVSLRLNFSLGSGSFALMRLKKRLFDFSVTQFKVDTTTRKKSWCMNVSLSDLALMEALSEDSLYPYIVRSKEHKKSISSESLSNAFVDAKESMEIMSDNLFFKMTFEINPLESSADNFLSLKMKPLEIVYIKDAISKLADFLKPPMASTALEDFITAAGTEITAGLKTVTKAGLQFALEEHRTLALDVDVDAPIFIFPESITDVSSYVTIFDLGHLKISSEFVTTSKKQEISQSLNSINIAQMESLMYDRFIVNLEELQIMMGRSCIETIRAANMEARDHDIFLLPKTDVMLNLDISILPNACNLTRAKIRAIVPFLQINFSDTKYEILGRLLESISPEPKSGYMTPATALSELSLVSEQSSVSMEEKTQIIATMNFQIQNLVLCLSNNGPSKSEEGDNDPFPLALLDLRNSNLDIVYRRFDYSVAFKLSEIALYDRRFYSNEKESSHIFKSMVDEQSTQLVRIEYEHFDTKSPSHHLFDNRLKIQIGHGSLQIYLPSILELCHFVNGIIPITTSGVIEGGSTASSILQISEYVFSLNVLEVKLVDSANYLSDFQITNIQAVAVTERDSTSKFSMSAGSIRISDRVERVPSGKDRYCRDIIYVAENLKLFDLEYESFNSQNDNFPGFDAHLKIRGATVTFSYVDEFITDIMAFYDKLISSYGRPTEYEVRDNTTMSSFKMKLDIDVDSPIILIYPDLSSTTHIAAQLGKIMVSNNFVINDRSFVNQLKVDLSKINLQSFTSAGQRPVLRDLDLSLEMFLSTIHLEPHDNPDVYTKIKSSPFDLEMTPRQYLLVLDTFELLMNSYFMQPVSSVTGKDSVKPKSMSSIADNADCRILNKITFDIERIRWSVFISANEPLAQFMIEDLSAHFIAKSDNSVAFDSRIGSVVLTDSRNADVKYRELIPKFERGEGEYWIGIEYFSDSELNSMLLLTAKSTRIQLVPDLLYHLQNFFTVGYDQSNVAKRQMELTDQPQKSSDSPIPFSSFSYRISLDGFQFWVLKDSMYEQSDAMVFSMEQFVLAKERILSLAVSKIGFYLCEANDPDATTLRIIQNFNFTFFVDSSASDANKQATSINIDIPEVIFLRISYHDILTVLDIMSRFSRVIGSSDTIVNRAKKSALETASSFVRTIAIQNQIENLEEFEFHCLGAKVVLIDDINHSHIPMFEGVLDPFEIRLTDWSSKLMFDGLFCAKFNYFNIENSSWEPLVETFKFSLNVVKPANNENLEIKFQNSDSLDLTISHAFLETYLQIQQKWSQASPTEKRKADDPYLIRNETGYPLIVWNHELPDQSLHEIDVDSNISWKFGEWRKTREELYPKRHRICIQLKAAYETIKGVPIDKVGCNVFRMKASQDSLVHKLIVDVGLENNVKVVTIRSAFVFENATTFDVSFLIKDSATKSDRIIGIPASKTYAIPLQHLNSGRFSFKPLNDIGYSWSDREFHWSDFVKDNQQTFITTCRNVDDQVADFICQLDTEFDDKDPSYTNYPHMKVKLLPPLQLENCLPFNFKYTIFDKKTRRQYYGNLESGSIEPIHLISPLNIIAISITIEHNDYSPSSIGIINNPIDFLVDESLNVTFKDGSDLLLKIAFNTSQDNSCKFVSILSPYIFVNKTGLDMFLTPHTILPLRKDRALSMKDLAIFENAFDSKKGAKPVMFSYSNTDVDKIGKITIRSNRSDWSKPFGLDAIGGLVDLQLKNIQDFDSFTMLSCITSTGSGKFNETKIVTICPKFIIVNKIDEELQFKLSKASAHSHLKPFEMRPILDIFTTEQFLMALRLKKVYDEWSSPFVFSEVGKFYVKLTKPAVGLNMLLKVEIVLEDSSLFIIITKESSWPYRIDNNSSVDVTISQLNCPIKYFVKRGQSMVFSWDEPAVNDKVLLLNVIGYQRELSLDELGPLMPLNFEECGNSGTISLEIVTEGVTFVLKIMDWKRETSIFERNANYRRKLASASKSSLSPQEEMFSVVEVAPTTWMTISIFMKRIGFSLVTRKAKELLYVFVQDVEMKFTDTNLHSAVGITVGNLQIDNQSPIVLDPIIFGLSPIEAKNNVKIPPIFQVALVKSKDSHYGLDFYRYFTVLLQEVSVTIDEDFLMELMDFFMFKNITNGQPECIWRDEFRYVMLPKVDLDPNRIYFEVFQLQPAKINMTFSRSEAKKFERIPGYGYLNIMVYLTNVLTTTIGNVTDAPIRFNALIVEHPVLTTTTLQTLVLKHYTQEFLRQLHRLIGAADFLGNPVGLFNTLGSGVKDVFYEPYLGIVSDHPQDFGIGIAKGASSFLRKTVFGFSDTFSKFTGSVGKGLASATLDSDFQQQRRLDKFRNRPKHAGEGVTTGATTFAKSFVSGFTGIIEQPIKGAEKEGFGGFMKGLGKGIVGAVTKPVVGVFDLASSVTEGLKHSTMSPEALSRRRVRLPRHIGKDKVINPYDPATAYGAYLLSLIENGIFMSTDVYVIHCEMKKLSNSNIEQPDYLVVTDLRIMAIKKPKFDIEWSLLLQDITTVKREGELLIGIYTRIQGVRRLVHCKNPTDAQLLIANIHDAMQTLRIEHIGTETIASSA